MTKPWQNHRISELCEVTSSKRTYAKDHVSAGVPFYRSKEIIEKYNGQQHLTTQLFITEERYNSIKSKFGVPAVGDVLITSRGSLGVPYVVKTTTPFYFADGNLTWLRNLNGLDSKYLYYWFLSPAGKAELQKCTIGSSQQAYTIVLLKDMDICLPLLPTQRKIAGVLSAYDDLIENNTRRIAILEEMAQAIYREWFVNFRFPGHEKVKLINSTLGKIPEGWKLERLADVCSLTMGQSPSSEFYNESGEGLPFHQGVTNFGDRYPTHVTYTTVTNRLAESGDVLFSVRAPVGRLNIADTQLVVGRGVSAIRHKQGKQVFLFHQLREKFKEEDTMGGGTIFKSVTKEDMQKIELISPSPQLVNDFEEAVGGHFLLYHNLTKRNRLLRNTRDLLLPKLISGQLDVEELDVDAGEPLVEAAT